MENINLKLNQYVVYIIYALAAFTLLNTCSTRSANSENRKLRKELAATNAEIDSLYMLLDEKASKGDIQKISNKTMFDFLMYEDDLDKKKTSLSDIKGRLDAMEKQLKD
jgi:hypothetical protein